jgi:hypothetical protein
MKAQAVWALNEESRRNGVDHEEITVVSNSVGVQFTFVQRFQQLYFLIRYCCDNTRKVRATNAFRRSGVPHMYWPHEK